MIPPIGPNFGAIMRYGPSGPLVELLAALIGYDDSVTGLGDTVQQAIDNLAGAGGNTAWDFIIETAADFPAPVAGVRDLVSGSYAIKNPIDLGTDRLRIDANVDVLMKGMGNLKSLSSSNATATIEIDGGGFLQLETLDVDNDTGPAVTVAANAALQGLGNTYGSSADDAMVCAGALRDVRSVWSANQRGLAITEGVAYLEGCRILGGDQHALEIVGASVQDVDLVQCQLACSADNTVEINSDAADIRFSDCTIACTLANGDCVHVTLGSTLSFVGGMWNTAQATRGNGLNLDGNVGGGVQVIGVSGESISSGAGEGFVRYTSGSIRRATVMGCNTATTVSVGISWAAANLPTLGLAVVGNLFDTGTAFDGFTSASARANSKANVDSGGLMTETAIVP